MATRVTFPIPVVLRHVIYQEYEGGIYRDAFTNPWKDQ